MSVWDSGQFESQNCRGLKGPPEIKSNSPAKAGSLQQVKKDPCTPTPFLPHQMSARDITVLPAAEFAGTVCGCGRHKVQFVGPKEHLPSWSREGPGCGEHPAPAHSSSCLAEVKEQESLLWRFA